MSNLIVQVREIDNVERHSNADSLDCYTIGAWRIIANRKDDGNGNFIPRYKVGDRVIFIPPDAVLPIALSDKLDITKYLPPVKNEIGEIIGGRVRAIRLRGEPSFGCMFEAPEDLAVGTDVAELYGITKWEPPPEARDGDAEKPDAAFHKYTDIENIRNFPNILVEGEEVVFTEKIHGTNSRVGKIVQMNEDGSQSFVYAAGSHGVRRKEIDASGTRSMYWEPLTDNVKNLLDHLCEEKNNVIVFGEIYGSGVQDMRYGLVNGRSFRAFDIAINGTYIDYDKKVKLFSDFGIEMAPVLYRGPFSMAEVEKYTTGDTTMCESGAAGKFKGREGIVVTPTIERSGLHRGNQGRVILKSISVDYLARKGGTDSH